MGDRRGGEKGKEGEEEQRRERGEPYLAIEGEMGVELGQRHDPQKCHSICLDGLRDVETGSIPSISSDVGLFLQTQASVTSGLDKCIPGSWQLKQLLKSPGSNGGYFFPIWTRYSLRLLVFIIIWKLRLIC